MLRGLLARRRKSEPRDVLLGSLLSFARHGQEEVSLSEILDGVLQLQQALPLGFELSRGFPYSSDLFARIAELEDSGYIRRYEYTHDGLLPKSYVSLTMLGRGRAEATTQKLAPTTVEAIDRAVEAAIAHHKEYWRLYSRI